MPTFFINQITTIYLTYFILMAIGVVYLLSLKGKTKLTWLLIGHLVGISLAILQLFLVNSLPWLSPYNFFATEIIMVAFPLALVMLGQYVYYFPHHTPNYPRAAKFMAWGTILFLLWGVGGVVYHAYLFAHEQLTGSWEWYLDCGILIEYTLVIMVLLYRIINEDNRPRPWWAKLIYPQTRQAQGLQVLTITITLPIWIFVQIVLSGLQILPMGIFYLTFSVISLGYVIGLTVTYLNYAPEKSTFMVKLIGISLMTLLSLFGLSSLLIGQKFTEDYPYHVTKAMYPQPNELLRFVPNDAGGYDFSRHELAACEVCVTSLAQHDLGEQVILHDGGSQELTLEFDFPFYDQVWRKFHIHDDGNVFFAQSATTFYVPSIMGLYTNLDPEHGGGIFVKKLPQAVLLTWLEVPTLEENTPNTFQIMLQANGQVSLGYHQITTKYYYAAGRRGVDFPLWLIGILPGGKNQTVNRFALETTQTLTGEAGQGLVIDYYVRFLGYLHERMVFFVYILGGAVFAIVVIFPLFFRTNLVIPLQALVKTTEEVNQGHLQAQATIYYNDEIGIVAQAFNHMLLKLDESFKTIREFNEHLEEKVQQRTLELHEKNQIIEAKAAELISINEELKELNTSKDKFFSIVAHDLKGPFMPLLGFSELLAEMGDTFSAAEVKMMGAQINHSARNTFNLLESLLTWARLQMGRMEYQPQRLDVAEIAMKTVELLASNAELKQIKLHGDVPVGTWVYADENMLDTVIRNLTNNALKFTRRGGEVKISARPVGEFVEVAIMDTGVGMSEEVRQKLFKLDQHVTTVGTGKETGTGLGLIICQEMVVEGGGRIWVESELGKGTTVKFTVQANE